MVLSMRPARSVCLVIAILLFSSASQADEVVCRAAGQDVKDCLDPLQYDWHSWRFVIGETPGPERNSEQAALADAIQMLSETFFCGLTYTPDSSAYVATKKVWSWTAREEAARLHYVGLHDESKTSCTHQLTERQGTVVIRRERRVKCPRGYNWLIRDEQHAVCVRE